MAMSDVSALPLLSSASLSSMSLDLTVRISFTRESSHSKTPGKIGKFTLKYSFAVLLFPSSIAEFDTNRSITEQSLRTFFDMN